MQHEPILYLDGNRGYAIYHAIVLLARTFGFSEPIMVHETMHDYAEVAIEWLNDENRTKHPNEPTFPGWYEENEEGFWYFPDGYEFE